MGRAAQKSFILERMAGPPTHSSTLIAHRRGRPKTQTAFVSLSGMCHDPKKDPDICLVNPPPGVVSFFLQKHAQPGVTTSVPVSSTSGQL